jgi:hypothetical protein
MRLVDPLGLKFQPFPIYTTPHASPCGEDWGTICQVNRDEFDVLDAMAGNQEFNESKYLSDVQIAFLRGDLSTLFKKCPECADLYGGIQNALFLLSQMNIANVPLTPIVITSSANQQAWNDVLSGSSIAETVWKTPCLTCVGWNGGPYSTYVGLAFVTDYNEMRQELILGHEMGQRIEVRLFPKKSKEENSSSRRNTRDSG